MAYIVYTFLYSESVLIYFPCADHVKGWTTVVHNPIEQLNNATYSLFCLIWVWYVHVFWVNTQPH